MIPGPSPPVAAPPAASKPLASPRKEAPKADGGRPSFTERAESILAALADGAREQRPAEPRQTSGDGLAEDGETSSGTAPRPVLPYETDDGFNRAGPDDAERSFADALGDLARTRQSYSATQARQRAAAQPPGSLLDVEV